MSDYITFIDQIGRAVVGVKEKEDEATVTVRNPAIIHIQQVEGGRLSVQPIPLYFKEFVGADSKKNGTAWLYNKANIVVGMDVQNADLLLQAYEKLYAPVEEQPAPGKVVKLFDEEAKS